MSEDMRFSLDSGTLRYYNAATESEPGPLDWIGGQPLQHEFRAIRGTEPGMALLEGLTPAGDLALMTLRWDTGQPFEDTCAIAVERIIR